MLLTLENVKNKNLRRFAGHVFYLIITLVLIPAFLYFELFVVLPVIEKEWSVACCIHYFNAGFLLLNIVGNMIYGMFTNTSIRGRNLEGYDKTDWTFCTVCESMRPPRAWHCSICDICILKRDHHCTFFACCVGYFNHRYFMCFTFYVFITMVYSFYFNVKFCATFLTWNHGLLLAKFLFPLFSFVVDFGNESIYVFLIVVNLIVGLFTGFLFFYHFNNILQGRIVHETKSDSNSKDFIHNKGWKLNLIEVFGSHWYLTWISPFIHSKLPSNGIEWANDYKHK